MSKNKYQRQRAMRVPTAGVKYQNEPIQAPLNQVRKAHPLMMLVEKMQEGLENQTIPIQDMLINLFYFQQVRTDKQSVKTASNDERCSASSLRRISSTQTLT